MSTIPVKTFRLPSSLRRLALLAAVAIVGGLSAPAAHAQWAVNDTDANTKLETANKTLEKIKENLGDQVGDGKTLNGNLDLIRQKMSIGAFVEKRPGDRASDPDSALPKKDAPEATLVKDDSSCKQLPDPQQENCKKIIEIQNAQYKFMAAMYANSAVRDQTLRDIIADRKNIDPNDVNSLGKLEENTNQLTALYNLIALDQQQIQTVNYAYDANLKFLREEQARLSREANTGKPSSSAGSGLGFPLPGGGSIDIGSAIGALVTGGVLDAALHDAHSKEPEGYKTLAIGKSNGW
ncbi:hypothetical protein [Luteibacter sp. CQ10]|uniref:hypothetical protein n=1 Tax=Luteibacter sp. CQ10 TaxID=2805821 RepID=UPI0034A45B59